MKIIVNKKNLEQLLKNIAICDKGEACIKYTTQGWFIQLYDTSITYVINLNVKREFFIEYPEVSQQYIIIFNFRNLTKILKLLPDTVTIEHLLTDNTIYELKFSGLYATYKIDTLNVPFKYLDITLPNTHSIHITQNHVFVEKLEILNNITNLAKLQSSDGKLCIVGEKLETGELLHINTDIENTLDTEMYLPITKILKYFLNEMHDFTIANPSENIVQILAQSEIYNIEMFLTFKK